MSAQAELQAGTDAGASPIPTQQPHPAHASGPHRSESDAEREHASVPLTGPLGKCCTRTVPHSGVARGTVEDIAGLATYVARPRPGPEGAGGEGGEEGKATKVILYFADVFGPLYINSKLAMDYWAAHGYLVLGVDYFEGDSAAHHAGEEGWDVDEWVVPFRTSAARITPPWIEAVREAYGGPNTKFFTVGYCFGGPFVLDLLATDWVTAGAIAHPAFLDGGHFRRLKKPLLISSPEDDFTFPSAARRRAEDIMVEQKATYYIQIFSGAFHGFATRPDPSLRAERWAKEESARAVLQWFGHHAQS
ncbi:Alpha/Beta hydrolase protein [Cubamyces lactineus]|nr:Alpha/Beta hydrolase protein [Cubamyces lactineus]